MVLLLHIGNDIKAGVYVFRGGGHGEAGDTGGSATQHEVVLCQGQVHALEHECYTWYGYWYVVACVESS